MSTASSVKPTIRLKGADGNCCWLTGCAAHLRGTSPFRQSRIPVKHFLARHVFVCLEGNHAVLLDLHRDQYLALDAATSERLTDIVVGWPTRATRAPDQLPAKDAELMKLTIEDLTQRGLITTDPHHGMSLRCRAASVPSGAKCSRVL